MWPARLRILIGPGSADSFWDEARGKHTARQHCVRRALDHLRDKLMVTRMCAMVVLQSLGQFAAPPRALAQRESATFSLLHAVPMHAVAPSAMSGVGECRSQHPFVLGPRQLEAALGRFALTHDLGTIADEHDALRASAAMLRSMGCLAARVAAPSDVRPLRSSRRSGTALDLERSWCAQLTRRAGAPCLRLGSIRPKTGQGCGFMTCSCRPRPRRRAIVNTPRHRSTRNKTAPPVGA